MKRFLAILAICLLVMCLGNVFSAFGWSNWKALKTDHLTVFYKPGYENQAWEVIKTMEHYRPRVEKLTGNKAYHVPIVIEDVGTITNGFCNPTLYKIGLFTYPPSSTLTFTENWWSLVGVHEYTHMLHLTEAGGIPKFLSALFGNIYVPNLWSPGWVAEGITVYSESQLSKYQGRLNDGYYDAYIGASIAADQFPTIFKATYSPLQFPSGMGIYLYGGEFFNYLARAYGQDKFAEFFKSYGSSVSSLYSPLLPYLGFDQSARKIYGRSFPKLWREWGDFESERFKDFHIEGRKLTNYGWDVNDLHIQDGKLYYQRSYPVKTGAFKQFGFNQIRERDLESGRERVVVSTTSFFTALMKIHKGKLYYAVAEMKPGYANTTFSTYGFYSILHRRDLSTGEDEVMLKGGIRAFDVLPDGNILYSVDKKNEFGSKIYNFNPEAGKKKLLFDSKYLIEEMVSEDDTVVVSARKDWENFSLYSMNVETGELSPLIKTPYLESNISIYNGKLFFVANYEKRYSAYGYELSSGQVFRLTQNGFVSSPAYNKKNGMLYFSGLNFHGHDLYRKSVEFEEFQVKDYEPSSSPDFELKESQVSRGNYLNNVKTLMPKIRFPLFSFGEENSFVGLILAGGDAVGDFIYNGNLFYNFSTDQPSFQVSVLNNFFAPLQSTAAVGNLDHILSTHDLTFSLDLNYPLVRSLSPGLSDLVVGFSFKMGDDFFKRVLKPYLHLAYRYPKTLSWLEVKLPMECSCLCSGIEWTGIYTKLGLLRYLPNRQVSLLIHGVSDPDNPEPVFKAIRGYRRPLRSKVGATVSLDYSSPLFPIRYGLWNPSIYFEDLCASFFLEGAFPTQGESQFSAGLEFHLEAKVLNALSPLPLDLGIRLVFNKEGDFGVEPILTADF